MRIDRAKLARVTWYPVNLERIVSGLGEYARICIQGVERPGIEEKIIEIVRFIRSSGYRGGISVAHVSRDTSFYQELYALGVDYVGLGVDVASERLRITYGKRLSIDALMHLASKLVSIYGWSRVYVHLIVGLGEYADELASFMRRAYSIGVRVALFAYTPVGVGLDRQPDLCYYRGAQLYRQLLDEDMEPEEYIQPIPGREEWLVVQMPPRDLLKKSILTSGCPACNRPYYNESPRGPAFNVPSPSLITGGIIEEAVQCFSSSRVTATSP